MVFHTLPLKKDGDRLGDLSPENGPFLIWEWGKTAHEDREYLMHSTYININISKIIHCVQKVDKFTSLFYTNTTKFLDYVQF